MDPEETLFLLVIGIAVGATALGLLGTLCDLAWGWWWDRGVRRKWPPR